MITLKNKRKIKLKRKVKVIILLIALLIIAISFLCFLVHKNNKVTFYINGQEKETFKQEMEYNDSIDISCKAMHLTAKQNGEDVTDKITYKKIKIDELKEYEIDYKVNNQVFKYILIVKDKTAPIISGKTEYSIDVNDTFNIDSLALNVVDNYDKEVHKNLKMDAIDVSTTGEKQVKVSVSDSSGNTQEVMIYVTVKEKVKHDNDIIIVDPNRIDVLVNKTHYLPDSYAPSDLVSFTSLHGQTHYLRSEATNKLLEMIQQAQSEGIHINVVSSYRTKATQTSLYNSYMAKDSYNAPYYSAYPRTSEHELGLGIDISYDANLHNDLHTSDLGNWMSLNAHKYGFILRYPYDKSEITGYVHEPWHYRYVGVDLATTLRNSNITLEEYYGK